MRQEMELADLEIPVKVICSSTDGGGVWFEYQYEADGQMVESAQQYGNPVAALRDGLVAYWA